MDQVKIGKFIAEKRKEKNYTQMQLAELLGVSNRAVSKWETGKAMPDSSIMLALCDVLKIGVADLLSGELVQKEQYIQDSEKRLLEMARRKEEAEKRLLFSEIFIGVLAIAFLLLAVSVAEYAQVPKWGRITLITVGLLITVVSGAFALAIEQKTGYYECRKCGHRHVPTYKSVFFAMHVNRTRYLKCPNCGKRSWSKKVVGDK